MIQSDEDRGLQEALELEGSRDESSKCRKSKIKYTRALLLELTEAEVCRKLPSDFDLLNLRQLDGGSDANVEPEHKCVIVNPFDRGPLPTTTSCLASPSERWDDHLYTRSRQSHWQLNCSLDRKGLCQLLPKKLEKNAGVVHCEIQKSGLVQLNKSENPYHPPHLNKKTTPVSPSFSEPEMETLAEPDHKHSADDITGHAKSGSGFTLAGANNLTKETIGKYEAFRRNNEGNEVNESAEPLDEYEEFWRENEGNEVIAVNKSRKWLLECNRSTFDDIWAEILETICRPQEPNTSPMNSQSDSEDKIQFPYETPAETLETSHLQEELNTSTMNCHSDSEAKIHFPNEESLTSKLNILNLDEINLPDENSVISIDDLAFPYSRENSKYAYAIKPDDQSHRLRLKAQTSPDFSALATHGKLHYHLPHNLLCDHTGFLPSLLAPNIPPHLQFSQETSFQSSGSVSHYSLLHQPNISPQLPNHLLHGTTYSDPINRMSTYDVDGMLF